MTIPRSRARGMPASKQASAAAREGRAVRLPPVEDGAQPCAATAAPSARFGTRVWKRPACDAPCMSIPVVWSPETRRHLPVHEIWVGVATDGTEVPERVDRIRDALTGHELVEAVAHDETVLHRVHDPAFVDHLRTIYDEWLAGPYDQLVGQDRVVPYVFPTPAMSQGMPVTRAAATHGRAGQFGYDTMTLVGPGTWEAARAAVDCALTAVDLVTTRSTSSAVAAYALCRPPGHHVTRQGYGGSCYLNNAAVAAQALRRRRPRPRRRGRPRRPPRQRHPGDLLGARRCDLRVPARRPGRRVVPALLRPLRRDRRGRRHRPHPQPPASRGHPRRAVAGGGARAGRPRRRCRRAGRLAGGGRRRRRPREPAPDHGRRVRRRRAAARRAGPADRGRPGGRLPPRHPRRARGRLPRGTCRRLTRSTSGVGGRCWRPCACGSWSR